MDDIDLNNSAVRAVLKSVAEIQHNNIETKIVDVHTARGDAITYVGPRETGANGMVTSEIKYISGDNQYTLKIVTKRRLSGDTYTTSTGNVYLRDLNTIYAASFWALLIFYGENDDMEGQTG